MELCSYLRGSARLRDNEGAVLITSLLILALITAMGLSASYLANTEVIIANNLETGTRSLYVAEGGLEIAKTKLNNSAIDNFAIDGASNVSMDGFTYSTSCDTDATLPCRTITHPLNWVDVNWFQYNSGTGQCTGTPVSALSTFPVCRSYTIGDETSLVIINAPSWAPSNPTKIVFKNITSRHTSNTPNKLVEASFEIEFGNNFAAFQELRSTADPTDPTIQVDNVATPNEAILYREPDYEYAMGGTGNDDRISGIYTGGGKIKIQYCIEIDINDCIGNWRDLAIPAISTANSTFIIGTTTTETTSATLPSDCYYPAAGLEFVNLPTVVLNPVFSGLHFKIVEVPDATNCPL